MGIKEDYLNYVCSYFRPADIKFYVDTDINICLERKMKKKLTYWECGGNVLCNENLDFLRLNYDVNERKKGFLTYQSLYRQNFFDKVNDESWYKVDGSYDLERLAEMVSKKILY